MKLGRLLLRLSVGGFFIGHGTQKLFGWFGGHGLDATAAGFEQLGLRPGRRHAVAAGAAEAGGGALLAVGLQTPLAASVLTATMLTAIQRVHAKNGPWLSNGGYEYNVVLIAAALTLVEVGPGPLSLDAVRGRERLGTGWTLAALATGVLGAVGAHLVAEGQPAPADAGSAAGSSAGEQATAAKPSATAEADADAPQTQSV
jgi:putative oxidoreductase